MKRVLVALAVAVLTVSACTGKNAVDQLPSAYTFHGSTALDHLYPVAQRKTAENFTGKLLDGGTTSLASMKGKVVVLNFWAAWCLPCRTESPQFDAVYRQVKSRGVDFVGIDTKDVAGNARNFVKNNDISYPIVFDEEGATALRLGNLPATALPFTVLIDKQGKVAAVYVARLAAEDLEVPLDKLLAER